MVLILVITVIGGLNISTPPIALCKRITDFNESYTGCSQCRNGKAPPCQARDGARHHFRSTQQSRAGSRGSASLGSVRFLVRAVWPDQFALPNRAFALRLRLE